MKNKRRVILLLVLLLVVVGAVCYTQITIFVVQPIGAVPEGRTLIISRLSGTRFIDSADAMCERAQEGVSLFCRGIVLGKVSQNATVYMRLPYSESLYMISTGGKKYESKALKP